MQRALSLFLPPLPLLFLHFPCPMARLDPRPRSLRRQRQQPIAVRRAPQGMGKYVLQFGQHNLDTGFKAASVEFEPAAMRKLNTTRVNLVALMVNLTHFSVLLQVPRRLHLRQLPSPCDSPSLSPLVSAPPRRMATVMPPMESAGGTSSSRTLSSPRSAQGRPLKSATAAWSSQT